jgi:hypothetical protein
MAQTLEIIGVLGRWSIGVQLAVVGVIAVFFVFLSRSSRLEEWGLPWPGRRYLCPGCSSSLSRPRRAPPFVVGFYAAAKTLFVLLLVVGTRHHFRSAVEKRLRPRQVAIIAGVWAVAMVILARQMAYVQVAQSLMVGGVMTTAAVWVLRNPRGERSRWLGAAFLVEGLVFLHYVPTLAPQLWGAPPLLNYVRYSSFFDAVAELLIALASLVALQDRIVEELRYANEELVARKSVCGSLDLDPLTSR